jgi:transposase
LNNLLELGGVVIGIDPHKASWTAAAVDSSLQPVATIRVATDRAGYRDLRAFAAQWPSVTWAIEGASGLGDPLRTWLAADQITALDVPAKLASRVRMLSTGHGRKSDDADATSVGIAARTAAGLRSAVVEEATVALRALVEHRDDVVATRTQTVNRLHVLLTRLLPGGAPRNLEADAAAQLLRTIRPRATGPRTLRKLAAELVAEVRHLDRRIAAVNTDITQAVQDSQTTLTGLQGIGMLTAAKILARVGDVHRFRSAAAFASYTGTAPIEVSSGDVVRHRLSRAGDRQLNCCLHTMAITQIRHDGPGRAYYQRKRAAGKSHKEALRCLKRRLSDAVYRRLLLDAGNQAQAADPGGHQGATLKSSAAGTTPTTGTSDKSLPGPTRSDPTTGTTRTT